MAGERPWVAAVLLGAAAVACSQPEAEVTPTTAPQAQGEDVARLVGQDAVERFPELNVGVTTCPSTVDAVPGTTFTCTQEVEGVEVTYEVRISAVVEDQARYVFGPAEPVIDLGRVRSLIRDRLDEDIKDATVDCGPQRLALVAVDDVITCSVTKSRPPLDLTVEVLVSDEEGTLVITDTIQAGEEGQSGEQGQPAGTTSSQARLQA